jgi:hypothetical protein
LYASSMPLLDQTDVVVVPVASAGLGTVLHSPVTPLVLMRAKRSWDGVDMPR